MGGGGVLGVVAGTLGGLVGENLHGIDGTGVGGDEHEEITAAIDDGGAAHLTEVLQTVKHCLLPGQNDPWLGFVPGRVGRGANISGTPTLYTCIPVPVPLLVFEKSLLQSGSMYMYM